MAQTYVIVDLYNLAFRVRYGMKAPDITSSIGLAMHIIFNSIRQVWNQFDASHTIIALEGRSWRKDVYQPYKANRKTQAAERSAQEIEDDQLFFDALNDLIVFLRDRTNASVLRHSQAEADDMIARWIHLHPNDRHVIVSTDSDFLQLVNENVQVYNGIAAILYTHLGVFDKDGHVAQHKGQPMQIPNPEWLLFEKCMRGDASDNIMSAYPGVRKKKLQEAFDNRHQQGFAWNNLMLSKWVDHQGHEICVRDAFQRNQLLIDLRAQPAHLQEQFDQSIRDTVGMAVHAQVGFNLIKFAHNWGLVRIADRASDYSHCLSQAYTGELKSPTNE